MGPSTSPRRAGEGVDERRTIVERTLRYVFVTTVAAGLLCVGVSPAAAATFTKTGTIESTDPSHPGRYPYVATTETPCTQAAQATPATEVPTVPHHYDLYTFANPSTTTQCVTVTYNYGGQFSFQYVRASAYLGSFNPNNLAENFLATSRFCTGPTPEPFEFNVPANSTFVVVIEMCGTVPPIPYTLTVSGTGITEGTTAANFRSVSASRAAHGVLVRWRTASEIDMLGFNVYRQVNGRRVRANPKLIPGKGRGLYSFLDRKAPKSKTVRYWIQAVNVDGSRSWYGPARVLRS